jgi:hypothetical protein
MLSMNSRACRMGRVTGHPNNVSVLQVGDTRGETRIRTDVDIVFTSADFRAQVRCVPHRVWR